MRVLSIMPTNNGQSLVKRDRSINQDNRNYVYDFFYRSETNFGSFLKSDNLPKNFTEFIQHKLFVGGLPYAEHFNKFKQEGITFVMDLSRKRCQEETKIANELGIKYIPVEINDADDYKEGNSLFEAVQAIKRELTSGGKGYVHCEHGEGRSRRLGRIYLSEIEGMDPSDAFDKFPPIFSKET